MNARDHGSYIEDIIEHMNFAEEFINNLTFEEFANDKKTVLSVTKCIEVVGEATSTFRIRSEKSTPIFHGTIWRESEID
jgi:uncharacterized protein with HEPN domain